ncbi:MAG: alpha/beta hydrolase [Deferrisomatales bacterium]|nr:alpha/beta hydrolase [Deferrisomatales bacterium]
MADGGGVALAGPSMVFLSVGGRRLEVAWHGPGPDAAPTLVFLHEGLGCVGMWKEFPRRLAEATGCGALVYSRAGYGCSDPCDLPRPLHYMQDEGLHTLPQVLAAAGVRDCVLVGHSDGGSIALVYAGGTEAAPLRGVITEAAHVFCEDLSVRSIAAAREAYLRGSLREGLARYHGDNVDCAFWGWNDVWLDPGFRHWNLEEYLPGVRVPLLALQGKEDEYGTSAQVEAIAGQVGGSAEVVMLSDCGHAPHRDQPETTLAAMTRFVTAVLGGEGA